MKVCMCCGFKDSKGDMATCQMCGEASWRDIGSQPEIDGASGETDPEGDEVADETGGVASGASRRKRRRRGER